MTSGDTCDECGQTISPTASSEVNTDHADTCSLHPGNEVGHKPSAGVYPDDAVRRLIAEVRRY